MIFFFNTQRRLRLLAVAITILGACGLATLAEARGCWRSCGVLTPRRYHHLHNRWHGSRDAFDLVSDMMSVPIYFNSLLRQGEAHQLTRSSTPHYTVSRATDGTVQLSLEIPGVSAKDLTVEVENGNLLRIRGSRKWSDGEGSDVETEFDRVFRLDEDVDVDKLKVTLASGILKIRAPRKEKVIRSIPIEGDNDDDDEQVVLKRTTRDVAGTTDVDDINAKASQSEGLTIVEEEESADAL